MVVDGEDLLDDNSFFKKVPKEKLKEDVLDKNFQKAQKKTHFKDEIKTPKKKKPLLKTGFILIIFGVILLLIVKTNIVPWMYISYDNSDENDTFDNFYFVNFVSQKIDKNNTVEDFFDSNNASLYLGINTNDFIQTPNISYYLSILIILLGFIFSLFVIIDKKINLSIINLYLFQTIFVGFIIFIFIYFISILVKFLGSNILLISNNEVINSNLNNLNIFYPAPIFLIVLLSLLLKLCFTVIKSNYREIYNLIGKDKNKLFTNIRGINR